jgi:hypothetical protein
VFGWFDIPHDASEIRDPVTGVPRLSRSVYQQWGFDAAASNGIDLSPFPRRVFFFNANGDHGDAGGGTSVFAYAPGRQLEPTFIFHETGHNLGLQHSFSDASVGCCGSLTAGEYCDGWDIMSAMCVFRFPGIFGTSGPGLNAPYLINLGWLLGGQVRQVFSYSQIDLTPVNHPELGGYLAAQYNYVDAGSGRARSYIAEFRVPNGWDRGIPNAAVLIRRVENGRSVLVGSGRANRPNLDWQVGDVFVDTASGVSISVSSIDPANLRATIYMGARAPVVGTGKLWAVTSDNKLWDRDPIESNVNWQQVGHANNVTAMAALNGKLWATTSDNKLWTRDPIESNVNWQQVGHANNVTAMTAVP